MKQIKFLFLALTLVLALPNTSFAQVKVGDNPTAIDDGSMLEIESTTKALVLPRMTTAQMNAIPTPLPGAMVFNTDDNCVFEYRTTAWASTCSPGSYLHLRKSADQFGNANAVNIVDYDDVPVIIDPSVYAFDASTNTVTFLEPGNYQFNMQTSIAVPVSNAQLLQGVIDGVTGQWIGRMSQYSARPTSTNAAVGHGFTYTTVLQISANEQVRFGATSNGVNGSDFPLIKGLEIGGTGEGNVTNVTVLKLD